VCHVPQITDDLHPMARKVGKDGPKCDCGDIIAPMVFGIYHKVELKRKVEEHFGGVGQQESFALWLMGKPKAMSYSNMVDLFMWYMDKENSRLD